MLFAELHAHAFELFAAAASGRAADLAMWLWQLMAPSVSNNHSVKNGPHTILASHRDQSSHTGINHQPIQSLTFHSIEPSLGQSSAQDVSTPKLVTAWAATTHKVQDISLHQGANNLGGEIFVNAQT